MWLTGDGSADSSGSVHLHHYLSIFLTSGRVEASRINYVVDVDAHAVAELTAKIFGHEDDIKSEAVLSGENAQA
jgi:hypothetical protein